MTLTLTLTLPLPTPTPNPNPNPNPITLTRYNFEKLTSGANLMIPEAALSPVESLPSYDALTAEKPELLKDTVSRTAAPPGRSTAAPQHQRTTVAALRRRAAAPPRRLALSPPAAKASPTDPARRLTPYGTAAATLR